MSVDVTSLNDQVQPYYVRELGLSDEALSFCADKLLLKLGDLGALGLLVPAMTLAQLP